jgi:hypothetical protein
MSAFKPDDDTTFAASLAGLGVAAFETALFAAAVAFLAGCLGRWLGWW